MLGNNTSEKLTHYEWLGRLAQDDACIMPNEALRKMREATNIGSAEALDDFIRAVRAGNMPRTDEPYATVARHIKALMKENE